MPAGVVIVGSGQAGYQTAASLRTEGYDGPVFLIGEEPHVPYQRPPLSKAFVLGKQDHAHILLRPEAYYQSHQIELLTGEKAVAIDRTARKVRLKTGGELGSRELSYDTLVLALGARNRPLPVAGARLEGVCYLRTLEEAIEVKQRLDQAQQVVIVGGGFIGLEIAASARTLGKPVTVIEALPRLMARVVAPVVSEFFLTSHRAKGVEILLNAQVREIHRDSGQVRGVLLDDGRRLPADLVVIGVGIAPNTELAREAGLPIANGISTSEFLRTPDERVFAIGDCAEHPSVFANSFGASSQVRLESVQNAVDQGVCVARTITGRAAPYSATPWFWSDQFDIRLQMAGLPEGHDHTVVRGAPESGKFSVFYFRRGKLCAVDSVNRPADHLAARKLIGSRTALSPGQAADENVNLKTVVY
jgi:3-phenylpropionate/trans-cinnamate dioxygenase ferredoxin reductase component